MTAAIAVDIPAPRTGNVPVGETEKPKVTAEVESKAGIFARALAWAKEHKKLLFVIAL